MASRGAHISRGRPAALPRPHRARDVPLHARPRVSQALVELSSHRLMQLGEGTSCYTGSTRPGVGDAP